jgi:hypothetical protein
MVLRGPEGDDPFVLKVAFPLSTRVGVCDMGFPNGSWVMLWEHLICLKKALAGPEATAPLGD